MTPIEKRKMTLELMRVSTGRMDLEIRIEEMKEEIARLEGHIETQKLKEEELKQKIGKEE